MGTAWTNGNVHALLDRDSGIACASCGTVAYVMAIDAPDIGPGLLPICLLCWAGMVDRLLGWRLTNNIRASLRLREEGIAANSVRHQRRERAAARQSS